VVLARHFGLRAVGDVRATWSTSIGVAFPARRANAQLREAADWTMNLDATWYARHQLPGGLPSSDGRAISRPAGR
jgi:hypothetical protein